MSPNGRAGSSQVRRAAVRVVPTSVLLLSFCVSPCPSGNGHTKKAGALIVYPIQGTAKHPTQNKQLPRANRLYTSRVYMASKERRTCLSFMSEIGRFWIEDNQNALSTCPAARAGVPLRRHCREDKAILSINKYPGRKKVPASSSNRGM